MGGDCILLIKCGAESIPRFDACCVNAAFLTPFQVDDLPVAVALASIEDVSLPKLQVARSLYPARTQVL